MDQLGFVKNRIIIENSSDNKTLEQIVSLNKSDSSDKTLFSFIGEFDVVDESSSTSVEVFPILDIIKNDEKYSIRIKAGEIFKSEVGETLASLGLTQDGADYVLNIGPSSTAIALTNKGEELIVEVKSTDGKAYKIIASGLEISIEYDGKVFSYKTEKDRTISTAVDVSVVEEFLDKDKKVCKTPNKITEFPNYLIGLFEASLEKNQSVDFGDYKITKIDPSDDGDSNPYLFITQTDNSTLPSTSTNYIYIKGKFQKCDNFICQYIKNDDGEKTPVAVLEVSPLRRTKNTTNKYYPIALTMNEDGSDLSDESKQLLDTLNLVAKDITIDDKAAKDVFGTATNSGHIFGFYEKDTREYAKDYKFEIKPGTFKVKQQEKTIEAQETQPEQEEQEEVEETEEKPAYKPEIKEKKHKIDLEKPAETFGHISSYLGVFLFAASVLVAPALGAVLAIAGLATGIGGQFLVLIAPNLKKEWSTYKKAKDKLAYYEDIENEAKTFAENFIEDEKDLYNLSLEASKQEEILKDALADVNSPINEFSQIYNEYGVGFDGELEYYNSADFPPSRSDLLCSYEGLSNRQTIASDLQQIFSARGSKNREELINNFINSNFHHLPKEKKEALENLFAPKNQPALNKFVEQMKETNQAQQNFRLKKLTQTEKLATLNDAELKNLITSKQMDAFTRKQFFKNYSANILKRFSEDGKNSQIKIINLINSLPANEKAEITKTIKETAEKMSYKMTKIKEIANSTKTAKEILIYKELKDKLNLDIQNTNIINISSYNSYEELKASSNKFLLTHDYCYNQQKVDNAKNLKMSKEIGLPAESKNTSNKINDAIDSFCTADSNLQNAWENLFTSLEPKVLDEIARTYGAGTGSSLYPSYTNGKIEVKKTVIEIAKKQTDPTIKDAVKKFELAENVSKNKVNKASSQALDSIKKELSAYGVKPHPEEVAQVKKKMAKENPSLDKADLETSAWIKVATALFSSSSHEKLQDKFNLTNKALERLLTHVEKAEKFVDNVVSGELANATTSASITKAIETKVPSIKPEKLEENGKDLKNKVDGYNNVQNSIEQFTEKEQKEIFKLLDDKLNTSTQPTNQVLLETLQEYFKDKPINGDLTFESIIADCTDSSTNKVDLDKFKEYTSQLFTTLENHDKKEMLSYEEDLDKKVVEKEYKIQTKQDNSDKVYENVIELLCDKVDASIVPTTMTNKAFVYKVLSENKYNINQSLTELGISKEIYNEEIEKSDLPRSYSKEEIKDLRHIEFNDNSIEQIEKFTSNWPANNKERAKNIIAALENNYFKRALEIIGMDKDIEKIFKELQTTKQVYPFTIKLKEYDENHLLIESLNKYSKELSIENEQLKTIQKIKSKEGKNFARKYYGLMTIEALSEEFLTKVDAVSTDLEEQGYDEVTIKKTLRAFILGDAKYFNNPNNPQIKLPQPYFFSNRDKDLCTYLGLSEDYADSTELNKENRDKHIADAKKKVKKKIKAIKKKLSNLRQNLDASEETQQKVNNQYIRSLQKSLNNNIVILKELDEGLSNNTNATTAYQKYQSAELIYGDYLEQETEENVNE